MFVLLILAVHALLQVAAGAKTVPQLPIIGPYKPNLYFGLRTRTSQAITIGLIWGSDSTANGRSVWRHTCEQNDGVTGWGWQHYDPRFGGSQHLPDETLGWNMTAAYVRSSRSKDDNDIDVSISATPRTTDARSIKLVVYAGLDSDASTHHRLMTCVPSRDRTSAVCTGHFQKAEPFQLKIQHVSRGVNVPSSKESFAVINVSDDRSWRPLDSMHELTSSDSISTSDGRTGNQMFAQFDVDVATGLVVSVRFPQGSESGGLRTKESFDGRLTELRSSFQERYEKVFAPVPSFDDDNHKRLGRQVLSNLLGGIGYFQGDSRVNQSFAGGTEGASAAGPFELLTAVPSRPFFPRGFLWDEGFHQLVIAEWDMGLTFEVLSSWFNLMDDDGWIAREQILGPEARSKVPSEFQIQSPEIANPPIFFLVVESLLDILQGKKLYHGHPLTTAEDKFAILEKLRTLYPLLQRQYAWFRRTQTGTHQQTPMQVYRWRGRSGMHTLPSGLDDYPRAFPPNDLELHVDLMCWIGLMADVLGRLASALGLYDDQQRFAVDRANIVDSIDSVHWSEDEQVYCDLTEGGEGQEFFCEKGYISLFPFITGLLGPTHPHMGAMLDLLRNSSELWSPHGIRSLSPQSPFYGRDENYWRGPIWININYLILNQLLRLAQTAGPHRHQARSLYLSLRKNLVDAIYSSWQKLGYVSEQYNQDTGAGQRTQRFTGWTSLIVKIMAMPDLHDETTPTLPNDHTISHNQMRFSIKDSELGWFFQVSAVCILALIAILVLRRPARQLWRHFVV